MIVKAKCIAEAFDSKNAWLYHAGDVVDLDLSDPNKRKLADLTTPTGKWIFEFDRAGSSDPKINLFFCEKCGQRFGALNELRTHSRSVHKKPARLSSVVVLEKTVKPWWERWKWIAALVSLVLTIIGWIISHVGWIISRFRH